MDFPSVLKKLQPIELLRLSTMIVAELKNQGYNRTGNNPIGDFTEKCLINHYGWIEADKSQKGYDALDPKTNFKFEIKARRLTATSRSRQISAVRDATGKHFDFLFVVIYDENYNVLIALKIPHAAFLKLSSYNKHTNSHILIANSTVEKCCCVKNVTDDVRKAVAASAQ